MTSDQTDFLEQFENYIERIDRNICDYVKESDEFGRHRNGLVQKENSISILKTQAWDKDISQHIETIEKAVAEEFQSTESQRVNVDNQLSDLKLVQASLVDLMRKLLSLHRKIQSTSSYSPFQSSHDSTNTITPESSGPAAVDTNPAFAKFDNSDLPPRHEGASAGQVFSTYIPPEQTSKSDIGGFSIGLGGNPFNTETGAYSGLDDTISKIILDTVPMKDLRQPKFDFQKFNEEDSDLKQILEEIREKNVKDLETSTPEERSFLSKWLR